MSAPYIVVAGGIASGKSTLARGLAAALGEPAYLEEPDCNPFLADFYAAPGRWALASQMWFLQRSLEQHARAGDAGGVQDHSAYEGVHVFGRALRAQGLLEPRELALLQQRLTSALPELEPPRLTVLLTVPASVAIERIRGRGRSYEQGITLEYLEKLSTLREELFGTWEAPLLRVNTTTVDVRERAAIWELASAVRRRLAQPAEVAWPRAVRQPRAASGRPSKSRKGRPIRSSRPKTTEPATRTTPAEAIAPAVYRRERA